jgi:phosphatidylglycerol:prolipoprotein diacylglycerol transferase
MRRARRLGLDLERLNSFITWMLVAGFVGGHVLDELFYHWDRVKEDPLSLVRLWDGLSSFGGFTGGVIGVVLWKYFEATPNGWLRMREKPQPILPFCDVILSVFPVAWIFGRSGCSSVHDHPGIRLSELAKPDMLNGALSVDYPGPGQVPDALFFHGAVPRFDLGLLELFFTIVLAGLLALTWRKKLPTGTYAAVVSLTYAPVRFAMDYLRITQRDDPHNADPRYGIGALALTPAQWECVALFAFGVLLALYVHRLKQRGIDPMDDVMARKPETVDDPLLA